PLPLPDRSDQHRPGVPGAAHVVDRPARAERRGCARRARGEGRRLLRRDVRLRGLPHGVLLRPRRQRADAAPPLRAARLMQVEQVDFVSVPTRDVERAVAWYRDALGLPASEFTPGEVEAPNVTLSFWSPEADGEQFQPNVAGIALRVRDVEAAVEEARQAG